MTDAEKVAVLKDKLEKIGDATYAQFQDLPRRPREFRLDRHVCPVCRRSSTAEHLHEAWALIQSLVAEGMRAVEEE